MPASTPAAGAPTVLRGRRGSNTFRKVTMATHHSQQHHLRLATYTPVATSPDTRSSVTRGSQTEAGSPQRPFERDSRSRSTRAANSHQCDLRHKHTLAHGSRAHTQALPTSTCDAHKGQTERVPVPRCQPSRLPGARALPRPLSAAAHITLPDQSTPTTDTPLDASSAQAYTPAARRPWAALASRRATCTRPSRTVPWQHLQQPSLSTPPPDSDPICSCSTKLQPPFRFGSTRRIVFP